MNMLAAASNTLLILLATLFVLNCVALIVFVLFRQSDTGGIGAAFGGGDGGGAFGTKGQAVVDKVITFMGATFVVLALVFSLVSTGTKTADGRGLDDAGTGNPGGREQILPYGMTGFGRASATHALGAVTVEVKSVNNRFLKVSLRLPEAFAELEAELEAQIRGALARGSVYVNVAFDRGRPDVTYSLNEPLLAQWLPRLREIARKHGSREPELADLLVMDGAVLEQAEPLQPDEALRAAVGTALGGALSGLREMRAREGESLARELEGRVKNVAQLAARAVSRAPQVVQEYRLKLKQRIDKLLADSGVAADEAAIAREVAMFADRCDVTEETTRLEHHCAQFLKALGANGEVGRKLDFVAQEMLREANTLASKANDAELAGMAVEMKSEIEKIKEQVQNLE